MKKIKIDYTNTGIKTLKGIAYFVLITGIIMSIVAFATIVFIHDTIAWTGFFNAISYLFFGILFFGLSMILITIAENGIINNAMLKKLLKEDNENIHYGQAVIQEFTTNELNKEIINFTAQERYDNAMELVENLLEIDEGKKYAYFHIGQICYIKNDKDGAKANWEQAKQLGFNRKDGDSLILDNLPGIVNMFELYSEVFGN